MAEDVSADFHALSVMQVRELQAWELEKVEGGTWYHVVGAFLYGYYIGTVINSAVVNPLVYRYLEK